MKRGFLTLKARVSRIGRKTSNTRRGNYARPALDNARAALQLISNLGSGAFNVPGLEAASKVGIQIIDIGKVGRLYIWQSSYWRIPLRKLEITRLIAKSLRHASPSSSIQFGRHSKIKTNRTLILVSKKILNVLLGIFPIPFINFGYWRCAKGTWRRSGVFYRNKLIETLQEE